MRGEGNGSKPMDEGNCQMIDGFGFSEVTRGNGSYEECRSEFAREGLEDTVKGKLAADSLSDENDTVGMSLGCCSAGKVVGIFGPKGFQSIEPRGAYLGAGRVTRCGKCGSRESSE